MFKVKWLDDTVIGGLTKDKIYPVERIIDTLYEILDDDGDRSLWFPNSFEIVEGSELDVDEYETID